MLIYIKVLYWIKLFIKDILYQKMKLVKAAKNINSNLDKKQLKYERNNKMSSKEYVTEKIKQIDRVD